MKYALCFPGQGAQEVGMGKALYEAFPSARAAFDEADDALSQHLARLIFEGPDETFKLTANTQPAIMTTSVAALRALENEIIILQVVILRIVVLDLVYVLVMFMIAILITIKINMGMRQECVLIIQME